MAKKPKVEVDEGLVRQVIAGQLPLTTKVTRHDIHVRSALYVSIDTKRKVLDVVKKIGSEYMTATSYVENIVRQHLELYKDDINRIYKQKSTKNLI